MSCTTLLNYYLSRSAQHNMNDFSEKDLEVFSSHYAPSARMAYKYASIMDNYDQMVCSEIGNLTFEGLGKMLTAASTFQTGASHQLLVVSPGCHRSDHLITLASRYIYQNLLDQLQIHTSEEVSRLYQIFVRSKYTKGSAGYLLEDIHNLFRKGGEWPLTRMTKHKFGPVCTHFISSAERQYMRLGYQGEQITIASEPLPTGSVYTSLDDHRFLLHQKISLKDGFYQPAPGQATTFDNFFIYNQGSKTAAMLQMTVGMKHDVKPEDVDWMIDQGVEKVHFVVIKPPGKSLNLSIPNRLVPRIENIFELPVPPGVL